MEIYIEIAILNNLFVDCFILIFAVESCRLKVSWWRILLGTILATAYAVGLPYVDFANNIFLKMLLSAVIISFIAKYASFAKYIFCLLFFYLYTFLLAGLTYAILFAFPNFLKNYMYLPALLGGCITIVYIICKIIFNNIIYTKRQVAFEQNLSLINNKSKVDCVGFWDSGNTLFYKSFPIIVISDEVAKKLNIVTESNPKQIKVDCVVGSKFLQLQRIEKLVIFSNKAKTYLNQYVAISDEKINYDVILNCDI